LLLGGVLLSGCGANISKIDRPSPPADTAQFEAQAKVHRYLGASQGTTTARYVYTPRETNQPDAGHDLVVNSVGNLKSVQIVHPLGGTASFRGNDRIDLTWKLDYQRMGDPATSTSLASFVIPAPTISITMNADEILGGATAQGQVRTPAPVSAAVLVDLTVEWEDGASGGFPQAHVTIPPGSMLSDTFTFTTNSYECPTGTIVVGPGGSYNPGARVSARATIAGDEATATKFVDVNCTEPEE
jgi:hypothetical protein